MNEVETPRLWRLGSGRWQIATGPARGTVLERAANPHALACFRWAVARGEYAHDATLRGLARQCDRAARQRAAEQGATPTDP
jgi:hypothetical protein